MTPGIQVAGSEGGWRGGVCDTLSQTERAVHGSIHWGEKEGRYTVCTANKQTEGEREGGGVYHVYIDCKTRP